MKRIVYVFLVIGLVLIGILIFKSMDNRLIYMDLPQDKIFDLVPTKYGKLDFQKLSEFQIDFTDNPGYLPSYKRYLYSSEEKLDLLGTNIDHLYIPFEMTGNRRMGDYPLFLTNDGSIVNKNIVNYSFVSYGEERNLAPVKTEVRSMFIAIRFAQYIDGEYMPSTGIQTTSIVKELPAGIGYALWPDGSLRCFAGCFAIGNAEFCVVANGLSQEEFIRVFLSLVNRPKEHAANEPTEHSTQVAYENDMLVFSQSDSIIVAPQKPDAVYEQLPEGIYSALWSVREINNSLGFQPGDISIPEGLYIPEKLSAYYTDDFEYPLIYNADGSLRSINVIEYFFLGSDPSSFFSKRLLLCIGKNDPYSDWMDSSGTLSKIRTEHGDVDVLFNYQEYRYEETLIGYLYSANFIVSGTSYYLASQLIGQDEFIQTLLSVVKTQKLPTLELTCQLNVEENERNSKTALSNLLNSFLQTNDPDIQLHEIHREALPPDFRDAYINASGQLIVVLSSSDAFRYEEIRKACKSRNILFQVFR